MSFCIKTNTNNFFVNLSNIPLEERVLDYFTDDELDTYLNLHGFKRIETYMTKYGWGDAFYMKIPSSKLTLCRPIGGIGN